jgi:hypothetical protein
MKQLVPLIFVFLMMQSCVREKYLLKGNTVFQVVPEAGDASKKDILQYEVQKGGKVKLKEDLGALTVTPVENSKLKWSEPHPFATAVDPRLAYAKQKTFYFPELSDKSVTRLTYIDSKPVLQTLAIPVKIRPALRDSFPSTTEGAISFGLAGGWKINYNVFKKDGNIFGQTTDKYSLSFGAPLTFGSVSLDKTNTRDPIIVFPRKAFTVSTGLFLMLGVNNIFFGGIIGKDFATGEGASTWLYNGKTWYGLAFAIDLIK